MDWRRPKLLQPGIPKQSGGYLRVVTPPHSVQWIFLGGSGDCRQLSIVASYGGQLSIFDCRQLSQQTGQLSIVVSYGGQLSQQTGQLSIVASYCGWGLSIVGASSPEQVVPFRDKQGDGGEYAFVYFPLWRRQGVRHRMLPTRRRD